MEKKKKSKINLLSQYTARRMRNIDLADFREEVNRVLQDKLTESELKLVSNAWNLIAKSLCDGYKYSKDDFGVVRESTRVYTAKLPLIVRKNIELYEYANSIKTIWRDKEPSNTRGQSFKLLLNE